MPVNNNLKIIYIKQEHLSILNEFTTHANTETNCFKKFYRQYKHNYIVKIQLFTLQICIKYQVNLSILNPKQKGCT